MTSQSHGFLQRILKAGVARPGAFAIALLVLSAIAAACLPRLSVDTRFDILMPKDIPDRQAYLEITRQFGSDNRTFLYLRDEKLWSASKLAALERLHEDLQGLPFVERVDDLFSSVTVQSIDGQMSALPLLAHAPTDDQGAELARAAVLKNPIALRNLVSTDGNALSIGISIREPGRDQQGEEVYVALEQVVARARQALPSLVQVGPLRTQSEIRQGIFHDLAILGPASALVFALAVWGLYRNTLCVVLALATGSVVLLWTFGLMGAFGIPLTVLSALIPPLAALMSSIGFVRPAFETADEAADGDIVDRMLRGIGGAPVISALALLFGFAAYAFSGIDAVRNFGIAMSFATLATWLATMLLLPLVIRFLAPRDDRQQRGTMPRIFAKPPLSNFALLYSRPFLVGIVLAGIAVIAGLLAAPALRIVHDPLAFFAPGTPLIQDSERMHEELAGTSVLYITLDANAEGAFRDPANLRRLADIQAFIDKQQVFDRSLSLADIVSQANQEAAGGRSEAYEPPPTRKLVSQYLVLHRPQDLQPYVSHDFRQANIVVRHNIRDSSSLNQHLREMKSAIAHYAGPSMTTAIVGYGVLVNGAADQLGNTAMFAVAATLAFVFVAVSLSFTSAKGGAVATVLSATPVLFLGLAMKALGIPMSMASILAAFIAIAVAVYGTSRLFARYSELCRNAASYDNAASEALKREAAPIVAAGLIPVCGFLVLLLADIRPVAQFAGLACLASLLACGVNVFIAPAFLARIRLVGLHDMLALSTQREALERCSLFDGLNSYQIRKTILISDLREYRNGEYLIEQGTVGRCMYLIVSGQVEVVRSSEDGDQLLAVLNPGDVFGEIGFVHETYRTANVRAIGGVSVLRFDHDRIRKDLALFPHIMAKLNFNISGILGKRLAELVEANQATRAPSSAHAAPDHPMASTSKSL